MKTSTLLYIGHFLSSWGDRMWMFAIPLFLQHLDPTTLTLPAVYGLVVSATALVFAPLVGKWIDQSPRLRAVRISLVLQNSFVILCAVLLLLNRLYSVEMEPYVILVKIGSISFGAGSYLASASCGIIIQKDWIVVISGKDQTFLAELNSMMRRIDLVTKILSPLICGQIMVVFDLSGGAIFIVCWNLFSMFVEYFLLKSVYDRVPALAVKGADDEEEVNEVEMDKLDEDQAESSSTKLTNNQLDSEGGDQSEQETKKETDKLNNEDEKPPKAEKKTSFFQPILNSITTLRTGWAFYFSQPIALPCFGFSLVYLTVLGFGYITIAYAYNQCFSELMMGILTAAAAITGIIATYIYPRLRAKVGLIRTGLFSAAVQCSTLAVCVASIFMDGSPFYILAANQGDEQVNSTINVTDNILFSCLDGVSPPSSFLSLSVLMGGIIVARIGLWGFDLTITQLIQETIKEKDRGVFSGVQNSLNNLMDMCRFALVIILPQIDQFGILVLISSVTVSSAYVMYGVYAYRERGHILPHCFKKRIRRPPTQDDVTV